MSATENGWTNKPSSIRCFDDWFRREDFGDRDQLERCWANAQNVAARDHKDASPSDFEQLAALREAAKLALNELEFMLSAHPERRGGKYEQAAAALREALKGESK